MSEQDLRHHRWERQQSLARLVNIARYLTLAADVSDQIILIFF